MSEELAPMTSLPEYHRGLEPAVCFQAVSLTRGSNQVLVDIDLDVEQGAFLGLIGPNGGGKTSLLNLILGTLKPSMGRVEVFGKKPRSPKLKKMIGYVPQTQTLPEHFPATVYDVALMGAYGASGLGWPVKHDYKVHARHLLSQVQLDHVMDQPISQLSGGQQQRAYIARALVTRPRLLLLDEPLRGLDASSQTRFFELLIDLKSQYELTVIMVSHHIHNLTRFSERIACLNRTIHWHDRSELMNHEVLTHTYKCELDAIFTQEELQEMQSASEQPPFKSPTDSTSHHHL